MVVRGLGYVLFTAGRTTGSGAFESVVGGQDAQHVSHGSASGHVGLASGGGGGGATEPPKSRGGLLGSANTETTPARAPAAAAGRKQQPDATCEGQNG